jgi:serine/threonine protein kinase
MTLVPGTKLGRYETRSKIGEGGMGEVYRARDEKLNRDVAIKVLPADYSQDTERLKRFEQEAQAAGSLNHANILAVYDVGEHEGAPYVVSELLEGDTLRQRFGGTTLAPRRVIDYALQIASGLAAAHDKGIVHRDLKPENLFVTKDGRLKILDFGIAKLTGADDHKYSQSEILTRRVHTDPGKVIGTAGYMSPEQVRGLEADHRSDLFSLGAILYEMLSGRRAFHGDSAVETMNAILKEDPPELSQSNQQVAPGLERVVDHCLEKNPEERFQSARDLVFALNALSGSSATSAQTATIRNITPQWFKRRESIAWIAAGILLVAVLALSVLYFRRPPTEMRAVRLYINPPERNGFGDFALSPDGLHMIFVATDASGKTLLWIRALSSLTAQPLSGTEEAAAPFWSPDSRSIGFFAGGKMKRIEATGGPTRTLCNSSAPRGATWSRDGVILFVPNFNSPLYQVSAGGGVPTQVTTLDKTETSHRWPHFLPDGRHFLYTVVGAPERSGLRIGSLDGKENRRLLNNVNTDGEYAPQGYLLFRRESALMAQAFDAEKLQFTSEAFPVAEQVGYDPSILRTFFSVSQTGVLAYESNSSGKTQLTWVDRNGKQLSLVGQPSNYLRQTLSPDEKQVAIDDLDAQGNRDIWIIDLARGTPTRFTFDPAVDWVPIWSPDGSRILFSSNREGVFDLYQKPATGAGKEVLLLKTDLPKNPTDWSPDGKYILYAVNDPKTSFDLWVLPLFGDQKPFPFLQTQFNERAARLSPDGQWIAYASDESGDWQVYVQSFPLSGGKWQVSTNGGHFPVWRRDGKELFYVSPDKKVMAVDVKGAGTTFERGVPKALFDLRVSDFTSAQARFAVSADGQRFLINNTIGENASSPIAVVLNWTSDLKK